VVAWVTVKNGQKVDLVRTAVETNASIADRKLDHITGLTNSTMSALKEELASVQSQLALADEQNVISMDRIQRLEELVTELAGRKPIDRTMG